MRTVKQHLTLLIAASLSAALPALAQQAAIVKEAPLLSAAAHEAFFENLRALCGKAFVGRVVADHPNSGDGFSGRLLMHVRRCNERQLQIPFHVGDNRSRTWIITKTGSGLTLKHDHRKPDGSDDASTMYGGQTVDAGWPQLQSFPADVFSKEQFARQGLAQSVSNTWQIYIYPKVFSYRLIREAREFRVDFDLTKPVEVPAAPWGYGD